MTLSLAWVRAVGETTELVMATDSRLRFGCAWDCGPKLLAMPRSDLAICFAGETAYAYPLMIQLSSSIGQNSKSRSRARDISDLKTHTANVFNELHSLLSDLPKGKDCPDPPDVSFIFGGYSWKKKTFVMWIIHFDKTVGRFNFSSSNAWSGDDSKRILIAGDYRHEVHARLVEKLKNKGKLTRGSFDMEPFEVLRDMIRTREYPTLGGAPQVLKIYEHMNSLPYAVFWPDRQSGHVTLLGRPLLDYEITERLILDPDTLETFVETKAANGKVDRIIPKVFRKVER